MKISPRGWEKFQHYKDRSPSWIKLHKHLLDDFSFQRLPVASRALAPMLWLIASEYESGCISAEPEEIAFRLRISEQEYLDALKPLISAGFFSCEQDASDALAQPERDDSLEKRREEVEKEEEREKKPRSRATTPERPQEVPESVWEDWLELRKKKRAPVTRTVVEEAKREANKAGLTLERFLTIWCARGSQGLQADWLKPEERGLSTASWVESRNRTIAALTGADRKTTEVIDVTANRLD